MATAVSAGVEAIDAARFRQKLVGKIGLAKYNLWFGAVHVEADDATLKLTAPNRYVADWIRNHFHEALASAAEELIGPDAGVEVVFESRQIVASPGSLAPTPSPAAHLTTPREPVKPIYKHDLRDFIVGPTNELAYVAASKLAEGDPHAARLLFIHGGCGLGKTHLLQGLAKRFAERDGEARVCYSTAEDFTNRYVHAVQNRKLGAFRKRIRAFDVLALDDVHFFSAKEGTQTEFLHTFDAIGHTGARIVLASDAHPKQIRSMRDALVSRFMSGMVVRIDPPDEQTRLRMVVELASRRGMRIVESAARDLARSVAGSVRELEGALTKLAAIRSLSPGDGEEVGHAIVGRLLDAPTPTSIRRPIRVDEILAVVCDEMNVERVQVLGRSRHRRVVLARSAVIHLARRLTTHSYPELARALSRPNHSTVVTAAQRIAKQVREKQPVGLGDAALGETCDLLVENLHRAVMRKT